MRRLFVTSAMLHLALLTAALRWLPPRAGRALPRSGVAPWVEVDAPARRIATNTISSRTPTEPAPPSATAPAAPAARTSMPTRTSVNASAPAPAPARSDRAAHATLRLHSTVPPLDPARVAGATEAARTTPTTPEAHETNTVSSAPTLTAAAILRTMSTDVASLQGLLASSGGATTPSPTSDTPPRTRSLFDRPAAPRGVVAASQGYVQQVLADAHAMEPPGVHVYYRTLSRRMRDTWRPTFYSTPSMVDALLAMPRRMAVYAQRFANRAALFGSTGSPDDPRQPLIPLDFEDRSTFSTRTTVTIVEVEQDASGAVQRIRVVRHARVREFDGAALAAVRNALPTLAAVALPGGRRVRFAFEVVASRDAIVPIAGMVFDETTGFFQMHYPGALHVRTRVRQIGSRPLDAPWPAPREYAP